MIIRERFRLGHLNTYYIERDFDKFIVNFDTFYSNNIKELKDEKYFTIYQYEYV